MTFVFALRRFLSALILTALLASMPLAAIAQAWPAKPVRLITGFAAGGPTDLLARVVGGKLQEAWGQPVVVEAKPGANAIIAMELAKNAPADGYFLIIAPTGSLAVNPHMYAKLPYDPVRDYAPIIRVADMDNVLVVHPSVPAKNVKELVALARSRPGQLTFGSPVNGSQPHLAGAALKLIEGIDMVHVPYKGTALAMNDLIGGQITMMFSPLATALPHVRSGKLRAIGLPSRVRAPTLPDVPTLIEQGYADFEAMTWYAMFAPAGTPHPVVAKIHADALRILRDPDTRERLKGLGAEPAPSTPEELAATVRDDLARWGKVIRASCINADLVIRYRRMVAVSALR